MAFMKDEMKEKDEEKLEEMKEEIDEALAGEPEADAVQAEKEPEPAVQEPDDVGPSVEELQQQIEKLEAQVKEKEDRALRLQADFDNFRRRTRQEKEEISAVVTQTILTDFLPLLDNFERAVAVETTDTENFQNGVEMIYKQLKETMQKNGLEAIETEGAKFDPNFHQAVMRVQNADQEDDTIAAELQKGYMVKGRVIRPSMVQVVSN